MRIPIQLEPTLSAERLATSMEGKGRELRRAYNQKIIDAVAGRNTRNLRRTKGRERR